MNEDDLKASFRAMQDQEQAALAEWVKSVDLPLLMTIHTMVNQGAESLRSMPDEHLDTVSRLAALALGDLLLEHR